MNTGDTYVRARIDADTKKRASDALEAMGLSVSGAIRLLMLRVADEHCLPFAVKVPTALQHRGFHIPKEEPAIVTNIESSYD